MTRRLLDYDGNVLKTFEYDAANDRGIIHSAQDCSKILDANKADFNDPVKPSDNRTLFPIARIPREVFNRWCIEERRNLWALSRHELNAYIRRKLNDPDWRFLKRTPIAI